MSFIWLTYRSRDDPKTAPSPKPNPGWVKAQKSWDTENTEQPAGRLTGWTVSLPRASDGQTSSRHFCWPLLLPGSLAGLRGFFPSWPVWE